MPPHVEPITPEKPKRQMKKTDDYLADVGILGKDVEQAKSAARTFLRDCIDEGKIQSTKDLTSPATAEAFLEKLSTKYANSSFKDVPLWYLPLSTTQQADRQLAVESIKSVFWRQSLSLKKSHPHLKGIREGRLREQPTATSASRPLNEETRGTSPESEYQPEIGEEIASNHPQPQKRRRTSGRLRAGAADNRGMSGAQSDRSSRSVQTRVIRDPLDHNERGLREDREELSESSDGDTEVLRTAKRVAIGNTTRPRQDSSLQRRAYNNSTTRSRQPSDDFEVPSSPELGPSPVVPGRALSLLPRQAGSPSRSTPTASSGARSRAANVPPTHHDREGDPNELSVFQAESQARSYRIMVRALKAEITIAKLEANGSDAAATVSAAALEAILRDVNE